MSTTKEKGQKMSAKEKMEFIKEQEQWLDRIGQRLQQAQSLLHEVKDLTNGRPLPLGEDRGSFAALLPTLIEDLDVLAEAFDYLHPAPWWGYGDRPLSGGDNHMGTTAET